MTFVSDARRLARSILTGDMLAIDPSSTSKDSKVGWAAFRRGVLIDSGTLDIDYRLPIQTRLRHQFELLCNMEPDVLAIEQIRGGKRTHHFLPWSCGVAIGAANAQHMIEVPVSSWKKLAGKDHIKGDRRDAIAIGNAVVAAARGGK